MVKKLILIGIFGLQICTPNIIASETQPIINTQQSQTASNKQYSGDTSTSNNDTPQKWNHTDSSGIIPFLFSDKPLSQCFKELSVIVLVELLFKYA